MGNEGPARHEIARQLEEKLGPEAADYLMEHTHPQQWSELATKTDLAELEARLIGRIGQTDGRIDQLDGRIVQLDGRIDQIDGRIDQIDGRIDQIDGRIDQIDGRIDQIDGRIDRLENGMGRLDTRMGRLEERATDLAVATTDVRGAVDRLAEVMDERLGALRPAVQADFRGELVQALAAQQRTLLLGALTTGVTMGGMVFAGARLL